MNDPKGIDTQKFDTPLLHGVPKAHRQNTGLNDNTGCNA